MPIMGAITSAIANEKELETANRKQKEELIARSKAQQEGGNGGPVSLLHGPGAPGFAKIVTPGN